MCVGLGREFVEEWRKVAEKLEDAKGKLVNVLNKPAGEVWALESVFNTCCVLSFLLLFLPGLGVGCRAARRSVLRAQSTCMHPGDICI